MTRFGTFLKRIKCLFWSTDMAHCFYCLLHRSRPLGSELLSGCHFCWLSAGHMTVSQGGVGLPASIPTETPPQPPWRAWSSLQVANLAICSSLKRRHVCERERERGRQRKGMARVCYVCLRKVAVSGMMLSPPLPSHFFPEIMRHKWNHECECVTVLLTYEEVWIIRCVCVVCLRRGGML